VAAKSDLPEEALVELESLVERAAAWVGEHLALTGVALAVLLAGAAGVGLYRSNLHAEAEAASDALDRVHSAYLKAMGANPGDIDVPELANPTAAAAIREQYRSEFGEVADEHPGTVAAVLARLEQGDLAEPGDLENSIEVWRETLAGLSGSPKLEAIVHQRIGQAYEEAGKWREAAEAYEAASAIDANPLRYWALADAARCFREAGDAEHARQLAERLEIEAPQLNLPAHVRAALREIGAAD